MKRKIQKERWHGMNKLYADIIVDISHENLDKTYQYEIPDHLKEQVTIGGLVSIPFGKGNRFINGYIVSFSSEPKIDVAYIKAIHQVVTGGIPIEGKLIRLAYWLKETFGSTMNEALKTVIPVKKAVKQKVKRYVILNVTEEEAKQALIENQRKNNKARVRLLMELLKESEINYDILVDKLNVSRQTIKALEELSLIRIVEEQVYRNPIGEIHTQKKEIELNKEQAYIVDEITKDYLKGVRDTYLIHGITGSGKTEVYMEIISKVVAKGKQVILLIPEIALTYQTVMRFYHRFGNRVTILNSKMSSGERYDQSMRAQNGEIDICIGPRSALFTPFKNLGLIIIDEEHETSYKSETVPKYHAREVAIERARMEDASVILGSATPSIDSYKKALAGEYKLYTLKHRAKQSVLPQVWIVDLREELKNKNRSIFSIKLKELITDRLEKKQQIMLFLNRRGYAGFVSCRSCGHVLKCPHCDISLTSHNNGALVCHYCSYEERLPKACPSCSSPYIAAFGVGTQKVEDFVKKEFPHAKVLRMDADTTKKKGGHEDILSSFANQEADILVGTQMIVKGHDFPNVTLVGILAADLSLYTNDYMASERTFQLLTQAAGRAGRGDLMGEVVIQTYHPEHYSIQTSKTSDYESFYHQEIAYRKLMEYPPVTNILVLLISSKKEEQAYHGSNLIGGVIKEYGITNELEEELKVIGPADASLKKANDIFRRVIYIKHGDYETLIQLKNYVEGFVNYSEHLKGCSVQFDFNPMSGY